MNLTENRILFTLVFNTRISSNDSSACLSYTEEEAWTFDVAEDDEKFAGMVVEPHVIADLDLRWNCFEWLRLQMC